VILELLASGALGPTAVRILRRHLTPENHESVLARATGRSRHEIDVLVAELAPRPDAPTLVRRLPTTASPTRRPPTSAAVQTAPMAPSTPIPTTSRRPTWSARTSPCGCPCVGARAYQRLLQEGRDP
jgi:hypothetical protein